MNTSNHRSAGIVESISDLTVELFSPAQISFFVAGGGDCILVSSWIYQFIIVGVRRDHKSLLDGVLHQLGGPSIRMKTTNHRVNQIAKNTGGVSRPGFDTVSIKWLEGHVSSSAVVTRTRATKLSDRHQRPTLCQSRSLMLN